MNEPVHLKAFNYRPDQPGEPPSPDMVWIPGGTFLMGSDAYYPEEAPVHAVTVDGFWMDKYTVTNAQFQRFVEETDYVTVAERTPNPQDYPDALPELLVPGSVIFQQPSHRVDLRHPLQWWVYVPGANWQHPEGPGSSLKGRWKHPVVHVAFEDAETYATWAGKALPTEAQWERAARGGLEAMPYTWGNNYAPEGKHLANTWQGEFPWQNLRSDGRVGTLPVGSFPSNGYGLYDMAGNVWEWTTDWYLPHHPDKASKSCCIPLNPQGATKEQSVDPTQPTMPRKVLKGGSFLCAPNYCLRYRPAARIPEPVDTSTCHIGFRCVILVPPR
jgi:formylglycine-generating enzyme required for sulfatase activity